MPALWSSFQFDGWTFHQRPARHAGAPALVALHGFTGSGWDFLPLAECVAARGNDLHWFAPDLPGHGATGVLEDPQAYRFDAMGDVLRRFCRSLPRLPIVVAYSMGARLALHGILQTEVPCDRLFLLGATAGLPEATQRRVRAAEDARRAEQLRTRGTEAFADAWEQLPLIRTQSRLGGPAWRALQRRRRRPAAEGLACALEATGPGTAPAHWNRLGRLACPTRLVAGTEDAKFIRLGRQLLHCLPRASLSLVPFAGHAPHLEQTVKTAEIFSSFSFANFEKMT